MNHLLRIIEGNARLTLEEIAAMLGETPTVTAAKLDEYKANGVIKGTRTLIDWEKVGGNGVQAFIEVRVTPKKGQGFDELATEISLLEEVETVHLMSGGFDLGVFLSGDTFQDVALFVARRLSPLDGVLSTATHFVLRTYKKDGAMFSEEERDERESSHI